MKPNLLKSSGSQTAVLDKETEKQTQPVKQEQKAEKPVAPVYQPVQAAVKADHVENKKSLFNAFSSNIEAKQEKQAYIKQETLPEKNVETVKEDEEEFLTKSLVDFKAKAKPKKKTSGFRFKLVTIVYAAVLAVTVGWVATNAVRLADMQRLIHAQDVKYVQKIAELDKLKEDNANNNDQLIPWDQLFPVQSLPLENVVDYQAESNWFDNIVNWFGKLFGG